MRYELSITIEAPREKVVSIFVDPARAAEWQPGLQSITPLSGPPGEVGSTAELRFKQGKGSMVMLETITHRDLPAAFHGTYEAKGVWSLTENHFTEEGPGRTRYRTVNEWRLTGLVVRLVATLMPGAFKKQSFAYMENLKRVCEG
jgi:carbon monoxide dehydrogenase subunit G